MSKESRKIKKQFINLIEDIFDNYDKYTDDEKNEVRNELEHLISINEILEKYDKKSKDLISIIKEWFNNATGKR